MATVDCSSSVEKSTNVPKESTNEVRDTPADFNNIQDGGQVVSSVTASPLLQQNSVGIFVPVSSIPQVVSTVNGVVQKEFPALQNTTKPIPASVFSYRFASPTSNQTPYYVSSDIVLSGGIAQQTRRRIVHNEVERRRKDKINSWIFKLADVVPHCKWGKQSKNIVLEKTVEYVTQVNDQLKAFGDLQQREQKLVQQVQQLKSQLGNITKENKLLKDLLKKHGIAIPRKILTVHDSSSSCSSSSSGSNNSGATNNSVHVSTAAPKVVAVSAPVSMTTPKTSCAPVQVPVNAPPPIVTMDTQMPISSACVAGSTKEMSKKESIAYVAPFIIANNPVSMTTCTVVTASPVVQVAAPLVVQNVASNPGQVELNQLKQNPGSTSNYLSNSQQSFTPQVANNLVYSSASQALQTVNIQSQAALQNSHAGFSQHSVAAIMNVALQPVVSNSPVNVVNSVPLATPALRNNASAVLNAQPTVINAPSVCHNSTLQLPSSPSVLPASNILNQQVNAAQIATSQTGTVLATNPSIRIVPLSKESQIDRVIQQRKSSSSKTQGSGKTNKVATTNKVSSKTGTQTQNSKRKAQSRDSSESKTKCTSNKRGAEHVTGLNDTGLVKRSNALSSQESQGNMNVCQPQEEIITLQTLNVAGSLISGQGTSVANIVPSVSTAGMNQAVQRVSRLSHSIAALAGLPQSISESQTSTDFHQHQQVSQSTPGNLSFSAESLLASSEVVLPNIPHIATTSVSENNSNQQSNLTLANLPSVQNTNGVVLPSVHSTTSEQSVHSIPNELSTHNTGNQQNHTQNFSNYSAEALIGGTELIGDIPQDAQIQQRPSRTTYSDFSAESLIGSSDLNSSLSYAIDNLISSRSDANYNSTAMVSVNPNLLHSVKTSITQDVGPNSTLTPFPDLVEQNSAASTTQPTGIYNSNLSNSAYGISFGNSSPSQFVNSNDNRRTRDGASNPQRIIPTVNSTNSVSATSSSFLKHSVDSITSSFYAASNTSSGFSLGPISTTTLNSFQPQTSFGVDTVPGSQLFGSVANPFSQTRPFFTHASTMGSFPV